MKFLVLWHFDVNRITPDVVRTITEQPRYGEKLEADGKIECRYHVVGEAIRRCPTHSHRNPGNDPAAHDHSPATTGRASSSSAAL